MKKIIATYLLTALLIGLWQIPIVNAQSTVPICKELPNAKTTISNTTQLIDPPVINLETIINVSELSSDIKVTGFAGAAVISGSAPTGILERGDNDFFTTQILHNSPTIWGNHLIELRQAVVKEDGAEIAANFNWQILPNTDLGQDQSQLHQIAYKIFYDVNGAKCQIGSKITLFGGENGNITSTSESIQIENSDNETDNSASNSSTDDNPNFSGQSEAGDANDDIEFTFGGQSNECGANLSLLKKIPQELSQDMKLAIDSAIRSCILKGNDKGELELFKPLSRAEMVTMANRILDYANLSDLEAIGVLAQFEDYTTQILEDLQDIPNFFPWQLTDWFSLDLAATVQANIFTGYPIDVYTTNKPVFLPAAKVLRSEAVKTIHEIAKERDTLNCSNGLSTHRFNDVEYNETNSWYTEKLRCLYDHNIVKGENEEGLLFSPAREITKGEFIKMLMLSLGAVG